MAGAAAAPSAAALPVSPDVAWLDAGLVGWAEAAVAAGGGVARTPPYTSPGEQDLKTLQKERDPIGFNPTLEFPRGAHTRT